MPGGDGTGPFGMFRNCMPAGAWGNQMPFSYGRRFFGRGRGFRFRYFASGTPGGAWYGQPPAQSQYSGEKKQDEISLLEQELEAIKIRLAELKQQ